MVQNVPACPACLCSLSHMQPDAMYVNVLLHKHGRTNQRIAAFTAGRAGSQEPAVPALRGAGAGAGGLGEAAWRHADCH